MPPNEARQRAALTAKIEAWMRLNSLAEDSRLASLEAEMRGNRLHFSVLIVSDTKETRVIGSIGPRGGTKLDVFQRGKRRQR